MLDVDPKKIKKLRLEWRDVTVTKEKKKERKEKKEKKKKKKKEISAKFQLM